jgi:hypothetical protein
MVLDTLKKGYTTLLTLKKASGSRNYPMHSGGFGSKKMHSGGYVLSLPSQ